MDVELAMTDCDLDRNAYPWITNLTVMDSIVLLGQANLLDLVDARVDFCDLEEPQLMFLQYKQKWLSCSQ